VTFDVQVPEVEDVKLFIIPYAAPFRAALMTAM
jgi:hypothetical protein